VTEVKIFDTTLRDGEQSPGVSLTPAEKLHIAHALTSLGVDVIEAGFPATSVDDAEAVRQIAEEMSAVDGPVPIVCALARATTADIEAAWNAIQVAERPRIHTFLASSPVHMRYKLEMSEDEVLGRVGEAVSLARSLCEDIEFTPEDSTRSDPDFLHAVIEVAVEAGATTINIADTVGWSLPDEIATLVAGVKRELGDRDDVTISVHTHDDLGMATANALAAVGAGARQVEVTMNGIGERAGNAALEEVVMALATRGDRLGRSCRVDATQLMAVSRLVREYTGMEVQRNKAIVGDNAFAHEAGIHQDGLLKHQDTYEILRPQAVGAGDTQLVLGKHSGRHALRVRLASLGIEVSDAQLDDALAQLKAVAGSKRRISDEDLQGIIFDTELRAS